MTAASLANMTSGTRTDIEPRANLPEVKSNKDAADQLNVGTTALKIAKEIKRDAPDLAEKVSRGDGAPYKAGELLPPLRYRPTNPRQRFAFDFVGVE